MKTVLLLLLACLMLAGCNGRVNTSPVRSDPTPALAQEKAKEAGIKTEAEGIVRNPTDSAFVSGSARRILDLICLSPWAATERTILGLVAERDAALVSVEKLQAQLDKAGAKTDQIIRLGLASLGALLIVGGVLLATMAAKAGAIFVGVGPAQAGAVGGAGGVLIFASFAYGWAMRHQSFVMGLFATCVVAAAVLWWSNRKHASD